MNLTAHLRAASGVAALALVLGMPIAARAATFAGTWAIAAKLGNPIVEVSVPDCVFKQAGSKIAGLCKGPAATGPAAGTVVGQSVVWQWRKTATNNHQITSLTTFRGTFSPARINGTWTDSAYPRLVGTFTGKPI